MIVITTPTGDIGSQLVSRMLTVGEPVTVIAREPAKLSAEVRSRVRVVEGSQADAAVVDRAFDGAEAVFWLPPPNPRAASVRAAYVEFSRAACEAIVRLGVKRVVAVSALGRGTPHAERAGLVTGSLEMEDAFRATGVALRALTMPSFMDNLLRQVGPLRTQGAFFGPLDAGAKQPTCATRDIAAAAERLLLDDSWTGQADVAVLGPEDLSPDDMAGIMTNVLGRPIRYERVAYEAFAAQLKRAGMSDAFVQGYVDMMRAKDDGLDRAVARTPATRSPTTFRAWCDEVLRPALAA